MSDYQVIPQKSIDRLLADPSAAPAFDAVFGPGRAAEVLSSRNPAPAPVEEDEDLSFGQKAFDIAIRTPYAGARIAISKAF